MKSSANDSGKLWRSMTEIEAEHQEIDYNDPELDRKSISDLAKVLSLLEDYNEESSGDRRTEDGDTTGRLALIIKTFNNKIFKQTTKFI